MEGEDFLEKLKKENEDLRNNQTQLNTALSSSAYQGQEDSNLIQYQIDTGEMLGKIEHFLRGEYIAIDGEGNEFWSKPKKKLKDEKGELILDDEGKEQEVIDEDKMLLNDYGVNSILSILGEYLDKNTFLSFYDEMRINEIMADLGDKLSEEIFYSYERIGLDTEYKKSKYPLLVLTILHVIESAYRRALRGKTMEDLNSSRIFTQMDNIGTRPGGGSSKRKFHLFKPNTW